MKFLKILFPILLLFSFKTYSQDKNLEDNLLNTVLVLEDGEKLIGKFKRPLYSKRLFCLAPTYKKCIPYIDEIVEKVDSIKYGLGEKYLKKNKNPKRSIQVKIDVEEYLKKIKYGGDVSGFSDLKYKGNNYDFYYHSTNYGTAIGHYIFITKPNSPVVIGHNRYSFRGKKILIKALKQAFPKCRAIENALDKKMFKEKGFNVYKILDKCTNINPDW